MCEEYHLGIEICEKDHFAIIRQVKSNAITGRAGAARQTDLAGCSSLEVIHNH